MDRITMTELNAAVRRINMLTGSPQEPYIKQGDKYVSQEGCYALSGAYGGYSLVQMVGTSGGERTILGGHMPKRELYERMHAFIAGISSKKAA